MVEQDCLENVRNCRFGYYSDHDQVSITAEAIISAHVTSPWLMATLDTVDSQA